MLSATQVLPLHLIWRKCRHFSQPSASANLLLLLPRLAEAQCIITEERYIWGTSNNRKKVAVLINPCAGFYGFRDLHRLEERQQKLAISVDCGPALSASMGTVPLQTEAIGRIQFTSRNLALREPGKCSL